MLDIEWKNDNKYNNIIIILLFLFYVFFKNLSVILIIDLKAIWYI